MVQKNQILTVNVEDINNLGYGVAKKDGQVIFVQGGVDGDLAEIKIIKVAKSYAVARMEKLLTSSPHRIESECKVSKRCGGCSYRNISYEHELEIKRNYVSHVFEKAKVKAEVTPVLATGNRNRYRNKAEYPVAPDGKTGFYAYHSHDIIPCDTCLLGHDTFDTIARAFEIWYKGQKGFPVRHLYVRRAYATGETMVCIVTPRAELPDKEGFICAMRAACPDVVSVYINQNDTDGNVILGDTCIKLWGKDDLTDILCGLTFTISPLSFYQVNHDGAELLYKEAIRRVGDCSDLLDLYCGAGTIGLCAASVKTGMRVTGVEIVPEAVENAKENARRNGIENASFLCMDAMAFSPEGFDCVITDPPRKGMKEELVQKLIQEKVAHIVYISCNPDTLARDAARLIEGGFTMGSVTPVDMFPGTGALECVTDFVYKGK